MAKLVIPRPFLKWAGGKRQLVKDLVKRAPLNFGNYHEPFVGGGALFFELYRNGQIHHAFISDLNAELIDTYIAIRDQVNDVLRLLAEYPHNKDFFYDLRSKDPWKMSLVERAARMIYLNKTCYNGLYRVNRKGQFNAPFGRYKLPNYYDPDNLQAVSIALQDVVIFHASFENVLNQAKAGDFVYFDPPYVPVSATANFTAYHSNGFDLEAQKKLRDVFLELTQNNVMAMLSNSATDLIQELYSAPDFIISEVKANRAINSNPKKRGKLTELIVTNYLVERLAQLRLLESRPHLVSGYTPTYDKIFSSAA
jgi:DNA adenine methylase